MELVKCEIKDISLKKIKAIIGPHNGYAYSGPTCAWAYKYIKPIEKLLIF